MPSDSRPAVHLNSMLFSEVLRLFNCPLSTEQTWAVASGIALAVKSHSCYNIKIDPEHVFVDAGGSILFKEVEEVSPISEVCYLCRVIDIAFILNVVVVTVVARSWKTALLCIGLQCSR